MGYDIGVAVAALQHGHKVYRAGWKDKGMYLQLQRPTPVSYTNMHLTCVYMCTAQGELVPWVCSQVDLLATDWDIFA